MPLPSLLEVCASVHGYASPRPVILNDVTGGIMFSTASLDPFTSVTCAQGEPAIICEKHRAPVVDHSGILRQMPDGAGQSAEG